MSINGVTADGEKQKHSFMPSMVFFSLFSVTVQVPGEGKGVELSEINKGINFCTFLVLISIVKCHCLIP